MNWMQTNFLIWLMVLTCTQIVTLVLFFRTKRQFSFFRRKYRGLLSQISQDTVPDVLERLSTVTESHQNQLNDLQRKLTQLKEDMSYHSASIGLVRYNAFAEAGNDLSFSLAIINRLQDGVVVTGIYNRGESNIYAKPVRAGNSKYPLSTEELQAIRMATEQIGPPALHPDAKVARSDQAG